MGAVRGTGRGVRGGPLGVRLRALGRPERRAGFVVILVVSGLLAAGPVLAARTFDAAAPGDTRPSSGSDRITEIVRQIRVVEAQVRTTQTQVTTLTQRRARVLEELEAARSLEQALGADVKAARGTAAAAAESHDAAQAALAELTGARTAAQAAFDDAQRALTEAQDRLESVSAAADKADDALGKAAKRLQGAKAGSKAYRTAFTIWAMAAIDERAAHARQVIADDRAADEFVGLQAAEAVLAEADYAHQEAESTGARAERAAAKATERVAALKAERRGARAEVAALEPEAKQLRSALKAAEKRLATLTAELERLRQRAAQAGEQLAGRGADHVLSVMPAAAQMRSGREKWRESGKVVKVLDGDTFDMRTKDGVVRVRINGIQAPESSWCGGKEAKEALKALLPKGTNVRLASIRASSGNAPYGVWRLKRTVHVKSDGQWVDIAPSLLSSGLVFPFPFIGEDEHNNEYLTLGWRASEQQIGVYDPNYCGTSAAGTERLRLEVVSDMPGRDTANGEFLMVFNGSENDINLSGWMVQDTSPLNAFFFPKGTEVKADDYVVVFAGKGRRGEAPDGSRDRRIFYANTGMIWNNDTAEIAFLFDDTGGDTTGNLRAWQILTPAL